MRAGAVGRHAAAPVAPESPVDLEGLGLERVLRDLIEDLVGVERPVVAADASVVATEDLVRTAVVLAEEGVQQCLARSGIAHVERVARLNDGLLHEIFLDQDRDCPRANVGGDVTGLEVAE
jgi:hypothetical protein